MYWKAALDKQATKAGKEQKQAEVFEDELADGGII